MADENDTQGIANLRAEHTALTKQVAALESELSGFRAEKRTQELGTLFKAAGKDPAGAALYTGEDVSKEAVAAWLTQHGGALADLKKEEGAPSSQGQPNGAPAGDENANPQLAAALAALQAQQQSLQTMQSVPMQSTDGVQFVKMQDGRILGDPQELMRAVQTLPYEDLVKHFGFPKPDQI